MYPTRSFHSSGAIAAFIIAIIMTAIPLHSSGQEFKTPDFAYPRTVEADAEALLKKSEGMSPEKAGVTRLRAMLELCVAQESIDLEAEFSQPAMIAAQAAVKNIDISARALLITLEANRYASIYQGSAWKYDQVDAPLKPFPEDVSQWSGKQFRACVDSLVREALVLADRCADVSLEKYSDCISYSDITLSYFPTVADFVRFKAVQILNMVRTQKSEVEYAVDKALAASAPGSPAFFYWSVEKSSARETLKELYSKWSDKEAARYVLLKLMDGIYEEPYVEEEENMSPEKKAIALRDKKISILEESLDRFPDWYGNGALLNSLAQLTNPTANYSFPVMVAPGEKFEVKIDYSFAKKFEVSVYPVSSSSQPKLDTLFKGIPIAGRSIITDATDGTGIVDFTFPQPGKYAVIVKMDGNILSQSYDQPFFNVSPINVWALNAGKNTCTAVVDFLSGEPVEGVTVKDNTHKLSRDGKNISRIAGTTGKDGTLQISFKGPVTESHYLSYVYKGRTYDFGQAIDFTSTNGPVYKERNDVLIFTDRSLYHPGDTVRWAVVCANTISGRDKDRKVLAGKSLKVELFDVNHQKVDSVEVVTDAMGRAEGAFLTRKGSLTGYYRIKINPVPDSGGTCSVMVSDFKLPTFEAVFTKVERDIPARGDVRLTGKATTYSGMPVVNAKVTVVLTGANRWRWFVAAKELATYECTTDADGSFTLDIPATTLSIPAEGNRPYENFIASATVVSEANETASASRNFTTGKPYFLAAATSESQWDSQKALPVKFYAYDADGNEGTIAMRWKVSLITDNKLGDVLLSGNATSGTSADLDLSGLPAGLYAVGVEPVDTALARSEDRALEVTLYNEKKNDVPQTGLLLFVPVGDLTTAEKSADILVGTNEETLYVYSLVSSGSYVTSVKLHTIRKGFSRIHVDLPDGDAKVQFITQKNGVFSRAAVGVTRPTPKNISIVAESFRDRLVPGALETWRFRLIDGKDEGIADAGMIAGMYNRALDALQEGDWPKAFMRRIYYYPSWIDTPAAGNIQFGLSKKIKRQDVVSLQLPGWLFYDMMRSAPVNAVAYGVATRAMFKQSMAVADEAVEEESAVAEDSATGVSDGGEAGQHEEFNYRVADVLQAFWKPSLTTDKEGNVDIVFTVPNANGGWAFRSFAWTKDAGTAAYMATCMSNKPVMVQPNLPRFLRQGDKARVLATVFNNTDSLTVVNTTVEIFNPVSKALISAYTSSDTIASRASTLVGVDVEAPFDAAAIGYRVRSVAGSFADGEQSCIPVLSAAGTVIESEEFYLNPGDSIPYTLSVPSSPGSTVTLQYCQNPVWTVVKAMRGIGTGGTTSNQIVSQLFSALAGKKIVESDSSIAEAIAGWKANPSEKALTSMLSRNETVKKLMLGQTPWVQMAADQSARMAALADLLDPDATSAAITSAVTALGKLQNKDGGFRWAPWLPVSSEWATREVLCTMAIANSLGMTADALPDGIDLQAAFNYIQREALKDHGRTSDREMAFIAALMPGLKVGVSAQKLIGSTVSAIASGWRKHDVVDKAYDILILNANGRKALASEILASIRQFGVVKDGTGMCFPSVDDIRGYATIIQAYKAMDASGSEIDAMRQWIIVQAQATDNLGAYNPDYVIAGVLLTGSDWTSVPVKENVAVDGKPLAIDAIESASGYFSQTLEPTGKTMDITVTPNGVTPSYGSVVTISTKKMSAVEARPGRDLSIEKRYLVRKGDDWVAGDKVNAGQTVRVQLIIKARRDLQYVSIDDERAAALEPVDQMPGYVYGGGLAFYRENLDASTRLFIGWLPEGTYHVTYDMTAAQAGTFSSGIATLQSQYAPELTAHSGGTILTVE